MSAPSRSSTSSISSRLAKALVETSDSGDDESYNKLCFFAKEHLLQLAGSKSEELIRFFDEFSKTCPDAQAILAEIREEHPEEYEVFHQIMEASLTDKERALARQKSFLQLVLNKVTDMKNHAEAKLEDLDVPFEHEFVDNVAESLSMGGNVSIDLHDDAKELVDQWTPQTVVDSAEEILPSSEKAESVATDEESNELMDRIVDTVIAIQQMIRQHEELKFATLKSKLKLHITNALKDSGFPDLRSVQQAHTESEEGTQENDRFMTLTGTHGLENFNKDVADADLLHGFGSSAESSSGEGTEAELAFVDMLFDRRNDKDVADVPRKASKADDPDLPEALRSHRIDVTDE